MNVMKLLGIVLLSIASIAVLVGMVLPVAASLILGLGIDIPNFWARSGKVYLILSYPWVSLLAGLLLLVVFGWSIWRLTR
jgi:hypothetical protein